MDNLIKSFENESFGTIRVAGTSDEPLFCLADLCTAIGVANHRNVKSRLDESDVRLVDTPTYNQHGVEVIQPLTFVTESGMYDVIIRSDAENAKPFRKWLTGDVLPSIRKTGSYSIEEKPKPLSLNDQMKAATWAAKFLNLSESSKLLIAKKILDPLGLPTPDYTPSKGITKSATALLKEHGIALSARKFNEKLLKSGFLQKLERKATKGIKSFLNLTEKGLAYGENIVSPHNPNETQPHFYQDSFASLLTLVGIQTSGELFNEN